MRIRAFPTRAERAKHKRPKILPEHARLIAKYQDMSGRECRRLHEEWQKTAPPPPNNRRLNLDAMI